MNSYNAASFDDPVRYLDEGSHNIVGWICPIVIIEFHVINAAVQEYVSVVKLSVQTDDKLYISLLEIIQAVEEGCGQLTLQR
jgi:hypothetical protein